ncbi:ATP-binding protein [Streptomyces sp. T028]|uniref:ATP-binding protein n=1 Tax=Streptomyces sp. T028 TaxID=3394379 RepID=UPI003A84AEAF
MGAADGVRVQLGTWSSGNKPAPVQDRRRDVLQAVLGGLYASVKAEDAPGVPWRWPVGGVALGVPDPAGIQEGDGSAPIDRILASVAGTEWAALVLAYPVAESSVARVRQQVLNELRVIATQARAEGAPSPLAEQYAELLKVSLSSLGEAMATGAWRTGVYLLGHDESYPRLAAAWRSVFSGPRSLPEPVRVFELPGAAALADAWALPDQPGTPGPGYFRRPFELQTLLTTAQLAAYVHLPELETPGFAVETVARFDTVAGSGRPARGLLVGRVVHQGQERSNEYRVPLSSLTRHAFVAGVTGSGKTNTVFHLLRQVARTGAPFLVVEPTKTEYRVLLRDEGLAGDLQVFTLGDETVSPFRLNPFEVPEGVSVGAHLDLLRSVFHASFGMWTPLPQVLEVCLHDVYTDRGWELTRGGNRRLDVGCDRSAAFPTLSDLVRKVEEVVPRLGYEAEVTGNIRAALRTRINSLRTGGKGRMLDVHRSLPIEHLLGRPTVLELDGMGDDDDKAFMMGLLMIRLAEHRRAQGDTEGLAHLLVMEEAHRLLANTEGKRGQEGEADVRGKAVETFTNLLSEVRAYGQGVVVVDQIPTKLAPDVLKNTNLKLAHRIVADDDREVLGATMVMTPAQNMALATLPVGRAAVFTDGEDAPLLLQVPPTKGGSGTWPTPGEVREHMAARGLDVRAMTPSTDCDSRCLTAPGACEVARALVQDRTVMRTFARVVLSAVQTVGGLERCWPDVTATVEPHRPRWVESSALLACLARHGARRLAETLGARAGWTFTESASVAERIHRAVLAHLDARQPDGEVLGLRRRLLDLRSADHGPFQGCRRIWAGRPGACLCHVPVAGLAASGDFADVWAEARNSDRALGEGRRPAVWDVCQDAAYQLVEYPAEGQDPELVARLRDVTRCVGLCFAQHMLAAETWAHAATERRALNDLLVESGHDQTSGTEGAQYEWAS